MGTKEFYRITVKGRLGPQWSNWFDGFVLEAGPGPSSTISGAVSDQAALHGVLARIRDLNLALLSVELVEEKTGKRTKGVDSESGDRC